MMLLLGVLLAGCLGLCEGLQTGLLYQYEYSGAISTWIPNDPNQSSGSGLRATVMLHLSTSGDLLVQVRDVMVGERHGKESCDVHKHTEDFIPDREMDAHEAQLLSEPFLVHYNNSPYHDTYLKVPEEPVWITNIRRGIVHSFPLFFLEGNIPSVSSFSFEDETMVGKCETWYNILKLSGHRAKVENKKLEEKIEVDVQRETHERYENGKTSTGKTYSSKTSGKTRKTDRYSNKGKKGSSQKFEPYVLSPINDTLTLVTRTLETQKCADKHFIIKVNGNHESVKRTQRSSEGLFLLRGDGPDIRLEHGEVTGDITVYTGKCDKDFMRITSKQVLQLRMVRQLEDDFTISYEPQIKALSFAVKEGETLTTKEKLLGIQPSPDVKTINKAKILEDLTRLEGLWVTETKHNTTFQRIFQDLVERITIFHWEDIQGIISNTKTRLQRHLLYQAVVTGGNVEHQRHLLETEEVFDDPLLTFQVLLSPTTPIKDPSLLHVMANIALNMSDYSNGNKAIALLNIAGLFNHHCLDPETAKVCHPGCDTHYIHEVFLPAILNGLQKNQKWQKLMTVQTICALGSPYAINYLQPIIQGVGDVDNDLRISAISCLTNAHLPKTASGTVFNSLMPLMDNPMEFPEIRSIAFIVLTTWQPSLSWWEHVAISTWKMESPQLLSFISSTLTTISEGNDPRSENVKKVIQLAKKPRDSDQFSPTRSTYFYLDEIKKNCQMEQSINLAWLNSAKSTIPTHIYSRLHLVKQMGIHHVDRKIFISNAFQDYLRNFYVKHVLKKEPSKDWEAVLDVFLEFTEDLEISPNPPRPNRETIMMVLEPLPHLIDLDSGVFSMFGASTPKIIESPVNFRLIESTLVLPSDIGFPIMLEYREDLAFMIHAEFPRNTRITLRMNKKDSIELNTLVPWSNGIVAGVGLDYGFQVHLSLEYYFPPKTGVVQVGVPFEGKTAIFSVSNVMYTSMSQLYDVNTKETELNKFGRKVVHNGNSHNMQVPVIQGFLDWALSSDFQKVKETKNIMDILTFKEPSYNNIECQLILHPQKLKNITFTFTSETGTGREQEVQVSGGFSDQVRGGFSEQVRGGFSESDYYSQVSQNTDNFMEYGQGPEEAFFDGQQQQSQQDKWSYTFTSHVKRMQEIMIPATGEKVYALLLKIEGDHFAYAYETAVVATRGTDIENNEKGEATLHFVVFTTPRQEGVGANQMVCSTLKLNFPSSSTLTLMAKKDLLEKDLTTELSVVVHIDDCSGTPEIDFQGTFDISAEKKAHIQTIGQGDTCDKDMFHWYNEVHYDNAAFHVKWTEEMDEQYFITRIISVLLKMLDPVQISSVSHGISSNELRALIEAQAGGEWSIVVKSPLEMAQYKIHDETHLSSSLSNIESLCSISQQQVTTFDRMVHSFEPSSCWTTAAIYYSDVMDDHPDPIEKLMQFVVKVRFTEEWEVQIISLSSALVIDLTRSELMVNEEPYSGHNDNFEVQQLEDSIIVVMDTVSVRVGETVELMILEIYHSTVRGICGNNDGEPFNDMTGPTGCLYTDHHLHTLAWSTPARGCSRFTLRKNKKVLSDYHEGCDKVAFQSTQQSLVTNCTQWKYEKHNDPTGMQCKSKILIPTCQSGCSPTSHALNQIAFACQLPHKSQLSEHEQCFTTVSPVSHPTSCFPV